MQYLLVYILQMNYKKVYYTNNVNRIEIKIHLYVRTNTEVEVYLGWLTSQGQPSVFISTTKRLVGFHEAYTEHCWRRELLPTSPLKEVRNSQVSLKDFFKLYFGMLDLQKICKEGTESSHILALKRRFILKNNLSTLFYMNSNQQHSRNIILMTSLFCWPPQAGFSFSLFSLNQTYHFLTSLCLLTKLLRG